MLVLKQECSSTIAGAARKLGECHDSRAAAEAEPWGGVACGLPSSVPASVVTREGRFSSDAVRSGNQMAGSRRINPAAPARKDKPRDQSSRFTFASCRRKLHTVLCHRSGSIHSAAAGEALQLLSFLRR